MNVHQTLNVSRLNLTLELPSADVLMDTTNQTMADVNPRTPPHLANQILIVMIMRCDFY